MASQSLRKHFSSRHPLKGVIVLFLFVAKYSEKPHMNHQCVKIHQGLSTLLQEVNRDGLKNLRLQAHELFSYCLIGALLPLSTATQQASTFWLCQMAAWHTIAYQFQKVFGIFSRGSLLQSHFLLRDLFFALLRNNYTTSERIVHAVAYALIQRRTSSG